MVNTFSDSVYGQRMFEYYPQVISCIQEFQAILKGEYPEFEELQLSKDTVLDNAYLSTMNEGRIVQWEKALNILPLPDSTLEDRRAVIIARIRGQGKLNTEVIESIVNAFTNGTCKSWVENNTLYVVIEPPRDDRTYIFTNVENELRNKLPAHIRLNISRNYHSWNELKSVNPTWDDINNNFETWEDVLLFVPFDKLMRRK